MRIRQKLNNNTGASMILALALLLVCVVVSSIILSTAASGLNRNEKRVTQQQEYLALSSAAELIAKELQNAGEYEGELIVYEPLCQSGYRPNEAVELATVNTNSYYRYPIAVQLVPDATHFLLEPESDEVPDKQDFFCPIKREITVTTENTGSFSTILKEACEYVVANTAVYEKEFSMSVYTNTELDERLPEVKCTFEMDTEFDIQVNLSVNGGESDYAMTVQVLAVVNQSDAESVVTTVCEEVHQIRVVNEFGVETIESTQFTTESPCYNLKISWPNSEIIKGVQ